jgi:adenylyltransferase/sulfurtransferase
MDPAASGRYSRQLRFPPIGIEGQKRLGASRAAIVGCGALGSFQAAALARAGVGFLRLIDRDYVELNNLQRQWIYSEADAEEAMPKAAAAARHLAKVNSTIITEPAINDLIPANAEELLSDIDLILDGTDNFETRYLINDFAVSENKPWIYGAAVGSYGLVMPILPTETACFACVYPNPPAGVQPTCETAGVLNTAPAVIAALQVSAAIQILTGHTDQVPKKITTIDLWTGSIRQINQPPKQPDCKPCGQKIFEWLDGFHRAPISLCGRNAVQIHERKKPLDLTQLAERLRPLGSVIANEFALRFTLQPHEMTFFADGRAIIKGTTDPGIARSLYARFIGN